MTDLMSLSIRQLLWRFEDFHEHGVLLERRCQGQRLRRRLARLPGRMTNHLTVKIGYSTQRPIIVDQHTSYVTTVLDVTGDSTPMDIWVAEHRATIDAYDQVLARKGVEMITSMEIVSEVL